MPFLPRFFYDDVANESAGGATKRTNEQIDFINNLRKQGGEEPLPYEQVEATAVDQENGEDEGAGTTIQTNETGETTIKIKASTVIPKEEKKDDINEDDDIDEEKVLKFLSKKAGKEIKSTDEIFNSKKELTDEEKQQKEQQRESAMLTYGLQNGKISKKEIETYIQDTRDPKPLVFDYFQSLQKSVDSSLTDSEIREKFQQKYSLDEDVESVEYKIGQKELNFVANNLINGKHSKYLSLNSEYTSFEEAENKKETARQEILSKAPQFKKDVEQVRDNLKTLKIKLSDTESYDIELDSDLLQPYVSQMLTPEYSAQSIQKGWSLPDLETTIKSAVIVENFDQIVKGVVDAALLKHRAGLRGVIPQKGSTVTQRQLTTAEQEKVAELKKRLGVKEQTAN